VRKWVERKEFAWLELLSGYDRFTAPYIRLFPAKRYGKLLAPESAKSGKGAVEKVRPR